MFIYEYYSNNTFKRRIIINKQEIIETLSLESDLPKEKLKEIYDNIFNTIANYLLTDNNVTIANFGTFKISNRKGRVGRNIATGETLKIKSHKTITFKISQNLKERLNQ